ncbi:MAG: OmpH family outer membrane protein [Deltaproteobacteria bacterium]|nr:MAG: OmpH family outer membrane protein [Deltaproteobacteria bacterium]
MVMTYGNRGLRRFARIALSAALLAGGPAVGLAAFGAASVAEAKIPSVRKIAVVDLQRVLQETRQGKAARRKMERSAKAKQKKLDEMRGQLESKVEKASKLSGEELAKAQERLQREYMEMQQVAFTLQQDLAAQEGKLLEEMYRKIQAVVAKLARKQGIDLVLVRDPGTVVLAGDAYDITDQVIAAYDAAHPK